MATAKRRNDKWSCRVYVGIENGKRKYKRFTADTRKEAERMANAYLLENENETDKSKLTVSEAMKAYLFAKSEVLSPSTLEGYEKVPRLYLQSIMNVRLCDLTTELIQIAVNTDAKRLSSKTVRNAYGFLTATMEMYGYSKKNITLPQKKKTETIIPTDQEMELICKAAPKYNIAAEVYISAFMGLRRSEISAINISEDVDIENKRLRISKAIVHGKNVGYVMKETKTTSSERYLAIPDVVLPFLEEKVRSGKKLHNPNYIEKRFVEMRDDLGLKRIRLHSLRHYFASTLLTLGVPNFYSMKLMGHSSDDMLKKVYQHINQDYLKTIQEKINEKYTEKSI